MTRVQEPTFPGPFHHASGETRLCPLCLSLLAGVWDPLWATHAQWRRCGAGRVGRERLAPSGNSFLQERKTWQKQVSVLGLP